MDNDNINNVNRQPFNPPPPVDPDRRGRGNQPPSSPPPNFTPENPGMDAQPFSGNPDYGIQFRGGGFGPNSPGNFRRCLNRFTFVWLINGNNFWFYPVFIGWQYVEGFRWRNGRWIYDRINLRRILFFRCF